MYEELNSEAYAKAGTEYLFVTVLSALCALANPDLILANKRIDMSLKTPSLTSQGSRATTVLLVPHRTQHAQLLVEVCLYAPPINFVMWSRSVMVPRVRVMCKLVPYHVAL